MAGKDKYGHRSTFPRFFKADFGLQQKVGTGTLDQETVSKVQAYLDSVQSDITPELRGYAGLISEALAEARKLSYDREEFLPKIVKPIMDIKSISGMFNEMMICRISSFVLTFLEDVRKLDPDVMDIVDAYLKVTKLMMDMKIRDETNQHGQTFLTEIRNACKRYYDKQASAIRG